MQRLERMTFDDFIWREFIAFMNEDGNHIILNGGVMLKPGMDFYPGDIPSRNPIVDQEIWRTVLFNHLKNMYN